MIFICSHPGVETRQSRGGKIIIFGASTKKMIMRSDYKPIDFGISFYTECTEREYIDLKEHFQQLAARQVLEFYILLIPLEY